MSAPYLMGVGSMMTLLRSWTPDKRRLNRVATRALVMVGNGPVGFRCLKRLVALEGEATFSMTVIGEEPRPAYDRVRLTSYLTGATLEELTLAPASWYAEHGIDLRTGDPAVAIDRERRCVRTRSGCETPYDTLILATGSEPLIPPIPGSRLPGVFVYRTIDDLELIRAKAGSSRRGCVLGGGLLGLEAAKALVDLGLAVDVIEMAPVLMPRQLDQASGELLTQLVRDLGVGAFVSRRVSRIEPSADRLVVCVENEPDRDYDLVVISTGVRPRDELARGCNLRCGPRAGIAVDDELRTDDPNIYAIGECVWHRNGLYGLAAPGFVMADTLAANLVSRRRTPERFEGGDQSSELKLLGIDVMTLGEYLNPPYGAETLIHQEPKRYRKLLTRRDRLIGVVAVGEWSERHRLRDAVARQQRLWPSQLKLFQTTGRLWKDEDDSGVAKWPPNAVVCSCLRITRGQLTQALADGCQEAAGLAACTGASTVCGSCRPLLSELAGQKDSVLVERQRVLLGASFVALACLLIAVVYPGIGSPVSVRISPTSLATLLQNPLWKQVTGFSIVGLTLTLLVFSLRKRLKYFQWGAITSWRGLHASVGVATIAGVFLHTGFSWGSNLNSALMAVFLLANGMGGVVGLVTSLEATAQGSSARWLRAWRPRLTWLHILVCWPLPLLIVFHVLSAYYY